MVMCVPFRYFFVLRHGVFYASIVALFCAHLSSAELLETVSKEVPDRRLAYSEDSEERLKARVGLALAHLENRQYVQALAWVEEYAEPVQENLEWPVVKGYLVAAKVKARIEELQRLADIEEYGLDFVLYREAQQLRRADHSRAMDFVSIGSAFGLDHEGAGIQKADFKAARKQYIEITQLFPDGVYTEASKFMLPSVSHTWANRNRPSRSGWLFIKTILTVCTGARPSS